MKIKKNWGIFSAQLVVSVVSNTPTISQIKYMQDMTSSNCAITPEGREAQLEDSRDGNKYWVGKMEDGKCWMLQNLALGDSSGATTLSYNDSNVLSSSWALPAARTQPTGSTSDTAIQSWNFGKWVLATPLLTTDCGNSNSGQSLSNCTKVGFVDVSSSSFSAGYVATTRSWEGANSNSSTLVAVNCTSWSGSGTSKRCTAGTYDSHYLVGNYYSWNAATAGTGGSITSGEASGSICPKGWRLPYNVMVGGFGGLLAQYGVDSSISGTVNGATYNIAGMPLSFVRSGNIGVSVSYVTHAGRNGGYWSSTPHSNGTSVYVLLFNTSIVNPSSIYDRRHGFSVRCIAE